MGRLLQAVSWRNTVSVMGLVMVAVGCGALIHWGAGVIVAGAILVFLAEWG